MEGIMSRKITKLDRIKSRSMRLALTAFRHDPSLGKLCAEPVFFKILADLKAGMNEEVVLQEVLQNRNNSFVSETDTITLSLF
jgi:hypothetical protein